MQTQKKPINGRRVFFSIVYLAIAVSIVLFPWRNLLSRAAIYLLSV
jgi:hypothetical protein